MVNAFSNLLLALLIKLHFGSMILGLLIDLSRGVESSFFWKPKLANQVVDRLLSMGFTS